MFKRLAITAATILTAFAFTGNAFAQAAPAATPAPAAEEKPMKKTKKMKKAKKAKKMKAKKMKKDAAATPAS